VPTQTLRAMPSLVGLYARALGDGLPIVGRSRSAAGEPPRLRIEGLAVDPQHLASYRRLCGFGRGADLPATYPQTVAFPLVLALLTDNAFPYPAMGLVHIGNRIVVRAPLARVERLDLDAWVDETTAHPRGARITIAMVATVGGEVGWRGELDLLHRGRSATGLTPTSGSRGLDVPDEPPRGPQSWRLGSDLGRRYAALSGDRNPIHLTDLTARPFGFRRHIAHGMWTHARAIAELANRLPDSYSVDVEFKKPVRLPSQVWFGSREDGGTVDFGLSGSAGEPHLLGRARSLGPASSADLRLDST
jgi:MaoC like domain